MVNHINQMLNYPVSKNQQVEGILVEEAVVEGPLVEGTVERSKDEKTVVKGSVVEVIVNKKLKVDKLSFK